MTTGRRITLVATCHIGTVAYYEQLTDLIERAVDQGESVQRRRITDRGDASAAEAAFIAEFRAEEVRTDDHFATLLGLVCRSTHCVTH